MLCVFILCLNIESQNNTTYKPVFYSLSAYYGFFHVHTSKLSTYKGVNPIGVEFEISQLLLTDKAKNSFGFYPKWSVALNYVNFEHRDLGYSIYGVGYFEPFIKIHGRWRFSAKIGTGIAFVSQSYHPISNPMNKAYSTKIAFPLVGGLSAYYCVSDYWSVKSIYSFRHISNGGVKEPNLGVNYTVFSIAAEYTGDSYTLNILNELGVYEQRKRQELIIWYSTKRDTVFSDNRQVVMISYNRSFKGGRINAFTLAGMIEYQQLFYFNNVLDQWSLAPLIGNEFILGRVRFGQQLGIYLLQGKKANNLLFQQYYLRYLIGSHLTTGVNLKVHGRVADHLTVQLGYVF